MRLAQRQSIDPRRRGEAHGSGCRLSGGAWYSPYDGGTETGTGRGFDIDHMVPLAEAWDSGTADWGPGRREDFANDLGYPDSLVPVTARSNRSKADRDPGEWQPPDAAARCWCASAWVQVKTRWGLSVDQREADTLRSVLTGCGAADMAAPAATVAPAPATSAPAATSDNGEDQARPSSETTETPDLSAGGHDRGLARRRPKPAPRGFGCSQSGCISHEGNLYVSVPTRRSSRKPWLFRYQNPASTSTVAACDPLSSTLTRR